MEGLGPEDHCNMCHLGVCGKLIHFAIRALSKDVGPRCEDGSILHQHHRVFVASNHLRMHQQHRSAWRETRDEGALDEGWLGRGMPG